MTFSFKPASTFADRVGLFVTLTGSTNSGKTFSAMRLARGIAGPNGKIAVLDTEGGRTLHLRNDFKFDAALMQPPFRPARFAEAAQAAEEAGYDVLVIDSFSMEWTGIGGVLDWQAQELERMAGNDFRKREKAKMRSWVEPKVAHKAMVYSFLQRTMPIIFSIRGEESIKPGEDGDKPQKNFKPVCNNQFPYEVTVSFRLESDRKGYIDLSDPKSWKMEGAHQAIFRHGDRISEEHGAALAEWARGHAAGMQPPDGTAPAGDLVERATAAAMQGMTAYQSFFGGITRAERATLTADGTHDQMKQTAAAADERPANPITFGSQEPAAPVSAAEGAGADLPPPASAPSFEPAGEP
ncbi:AAA family ATPase [Chelatococcus reniformis]|uniref:AAA family ATPase n=1 Tax=Chelatococcus reniformis TaxID=1494448 RepID=A0A916UWV0_9HYPH|nr:AAA family ATPase [Chelatococcus reniformis]GGC90690.1 hypothetical protein GCM10010994_55610 [Chelatococcus reniformis]